MEHQVITQPFLTFIYPYGIFLVILVTHFVYIVCYYLKFSTRLIKIVVVAVGYLLLTILMLLWIYSFKHFDPHYFATQNELDSIYVSYKTTKEAWACGYETAYIDIFVLWNQHRTKCQIVIQPFLTFIYPYGVVLSILILLFVYFVCQHLKFPIQITIILICVVSYILLNVLTLLWVCSFIDFDPIYFISHRDWSHDYTVFDTPREAFDKGYEAAYLDIFSPRILHNHPTVIK